MEWGEPSSIQVIVMLLFSVSTWARLGWLTATAVRASSQSNAAATASASRWR
jgi:hypothetical protein